MSDSISLDISKFPQHRKQTGSPCGLFTEKEFRFLAVALRNDAFHEINYKTCLYSNELLKKVVAFLRRELSGQTFSNDLSHCPTLDNNKWGFDEFYNEEEDSSDEKSPEEYLTEKDEANLISLQASNYCKAQGVTDEDVLYFDGKVKEMMESVRNLKTTLSEGVRIDDMFKVDRPRGHDSGERTNDENDIKASMEEIEKMDVVLRLKAAEGRKAKLCRIQAEEQSRDVLIGLPCSEVSNGFKVNLEEFIKLLNDMEGTESDSSGVENANPVDGPDEGEKKRDGSTEGKKVENRNGEERKAKNWKFVEKNIQLAKCGRGTLSLTEEERLRIEELLLEEAGGRSKELYAIDDETKSVLTRIEERLEAVTEGQSTGRSRSKMSFLEEMEENVKHGNKVEKKRRNRLAEINKLLNDVKSVSEEEITPLSEEEIESLLEESRRSLGAVGKEEDEEQKKKSLEGSGGVIGELVSNAKLFMPKFKYRFGES